VKGAVPNDGAHKPDCFRAPQIVNAPYSEGCRQVQRRLPAAARPCRAGCAPIASCGRQVIGTCSRNASLAASL